LDKNIPILSKLPNLKSLHIENDGLKKLPKSIFQLNNLESLYLNNNQFKKVPMEVQGLKNLKYLDLHDNKYRLSDPFNQGQSFGPKIRF
jgi:Leucine-rich repeat (LRR) protein